MFILKIFDSEGTELKNNDLVQVQSARNFNLTFFTRIQVIDGQIFPFNKFSYDRIIKIDAIPEGCLHNPANIERNFPEYWMHPHHQLKLIATDSLDRWRMDVLTFKNNSFQKISAE